MQTPKQASQTLMHQIAHPKSFRDFFANVIRWSALPGKHHFLKWPSAILALVVTYGIFSVLQLDIVVFAKDHLIGGLIVTALCFAAVLGYGYYIAFRRQHRTQDLPKWNWPRTIRNTFLSFLALFGGGVLLNYVFQLAFHVGGKASNNQQALNVMMRLSPADAVFMCLLIIFMAPIMEEITFRYFILGPQAIKAPFAFQTTKIRRIIYAIVSAGIFTYLHSMTEFQLAAMNSFNNTTANLQFFQVFCSYAWIAAVLTYVYFKTSDIRKSMLVHMTWNTFTVILMLATLH